MVFILSFYANIISNYAGWTEVGNNKDTTFWFTCMRNITNDLDIEKSYFICDTLGETIILTIHHTIYIPTI